VKKTLIALVALFLTGCSGTVLTNGPFGDLSKLTATDIQAALADATAHGDKAAMQCYPVLLGVLADLQAKSAAPVNVAGVVSAFQAARDLAKTVQSNAGGNELVQAVNLGCAALFNDAQGDILRLAAKFRP
jgi:hypothetical protein